LALSASPPLAGGVVREAWRFLDAGEAEEKEAIERAKATLAPDFAAASRDFDAATRRLAGLVLSGLVDRRALRGVARREAADGRHRRALASYRALFADDYAAGDADLAFEVGKSASRVDSGLAALWDSRGRALIGFQALERGDLEEALRDFRAAVSKDAGSAAAKYGLARALGRAGQPEEAAPYLREAIALDPEALERAKAEPDLAAVLPRVETKPAGK